MATIRTTYKYACDLDKGTYEVNLRSPLMQADSQADAFRVSVTRNGADVDVSGMNAYGYMYIAANQTTVALGGTVSGNMAEVVLTSDCYAVPGYASLVIQLHEGDVRHTVLKVNMYIERTGGNKVLTGGDVLPALAELLGKISAVEQATEEAQTAAAAADEAREGIQGNLEELAGEIESETYNLSVAVDDKTDDLSIITDGHFKKIPYTFRTQGDYYKVVDGSPVVQGQRLSSDMMPAPRNLCLDFGSETAANCYIYFYNKNDNGEFEVTFEPWYYDETDNKTINYASSGSLEERMIANIPDGTYMQICKLAGLVTLYAWDGEPFGMDVCATPSIPIHPSGESWLSKAGGSGITVHGKAKHIIANGAKLRIVHGFKDGVETQLNTATKSFYTFPEGYDHFRIRLEMDTEDGQLKTFTGDVRDMVYIVASTTEERPISNAVKVIANCRRACDLTWTPRKNIVLHNNTTINFKLGLEYNGLIYSSQWDRARIVGWHVSPHTFLNAVNDETSIMYNETADNGEGVVAPIYGTVCSAFATMCDGWECPQTNAGFFYDPEIEKYYSHKPQLGQIYTDIKHHCVIPAGITQIDNDSIVSAYEAVHPVSTKTARFMSISHQDIWEWWNLSGGLDFYNDYGYVIHNPRANPDISTVPYADFAGAAITNGSARPYKGDKSVYTSAEAKVLINIKNEAATVLYLAAENGSVQQIPVSGADAIDVKPYLSFGSKENAYEDAYQIYYVYTDADDVKESFEYIEAAPVTFTIKDDSLSFSSDEFWYADCTFAGIHYYQKADGSYETRNGSVLANSAGDYSKWFRNGNRITAVSAVFRKGQYGAYTVPISQNENT